MWADVTELAEAVMTSAAPPAGFVRRKLPIGGTSADVYTGVTEGRSSAPTTVVVVIASAEGARPTRAELRRGFGLTPREADVALLLAARRSNKEIARHLSIAARTAARHTESVMAKLNTSSRREVARILRRQPWMGSDASPNRSTHGRVDG